MALEGHTAVRGDAGMNLPVKIAHVNTHLMEVGRARREELAGGWRGEGKGESNGDS